MTITEPVRVLPYGQESHEALVRPTHDEQSRQEFVKSLKAYLATNISPGNKDLYDKKVVPEFVAQHGRTPADRHEVRREMEQENYYRTWCVLQRASQEIKWDAVISSVERQLPEMIERAAE